MPTTRDFSRVIAARLAADPELRAGVEKERLNAAIARLIHDERIKCKLTQQQLAELVGTRQPVIARLENADYDGHSLTLLWRIAAALGKRLRIDFQPLAASASGPRRNGPRPDSAGRIRKNKSLR